MFIYCFSNFSDAYKDNFVAMNEAVRAKVIRPNIECTNGYIHLIDTVMLDDAPPYAVIASKATETSAYYTKLICSIQMTLFLLAFLYD